MRFLALITVASLLGLNISAGGAQATQSVAERATKTSKLRMALIPVDKTDMGDFTKPMISASFEEAMLKAGRFITLSRAELEAIQSEQRFAASGEVDPSSAVRLGKALSANYAVIVRQLAFDAKEGKDAMASLLGVGKKTNTYSLTLQAQAIDVETSEIVLSKTFSKQFKMSEFTLDASVASEATNAWVAPYKLALDTFAEAFTSEFAASIPLQAIVVLVRDANNIAINAGADAGLRAGSRFELIEEGQPIKDPSGAILGYDSKTIGVAEIVRVDGKLSWLKLTETFSAPGSADATPDITKVKQYVLARMITSSK